MTKSRYKTEEGTEYIQRRILNKKTGVSGEIWEKIMKIGVRPLETAVLVSSAIAREYYAKSKNAYDWISQLKELDEAIRVSGSNLRIAYISQGEYGLSSKIVSRNLPSEKKNLEKKVSDPTQLALEGLARKSIKS